MVDGMIKPLDVIEDPFPLIIIESLIDTINSLVDTVNDLETRVSRLEEEVAIDPESRIDW